MRTNTSKTHLNSDSFSDRGLMGDHVPEHANDQPSLSSTRHACILSQSTNVHENNSGRMHSQHHTKNHNFTYHHQRMSELYAHNNNNNNNNSMHHATRTTSLKKEKDHSHACSSSTSGGREGVSSRIMHDCRKDYEKRSPTIDSRMTIIDETCMTVIASKESKIRKRKRSWFMQQQQHLKSERLTSTLACSTGIYLENNNNYQFHQNGNNKLRSEEKIDFLEQPQPQQLSDTTAGHDLHGKIYAFERPLFSKSCNFVKNYYVLNIKNVIKDNETTDNEQHVVLNTCDVKTQKPNTTNHAESHHNCSSSNSTLLFLYLEEELSTLVPAPSKPMHESLIEASTRRFPCDYTGVSEIFNREELADSCTSKTFNDHNSHTLEHMGNQHVQQVINLCYEMIQLSTPNRTFL